MGMREKLIELIDQYYSDPRIQSFEDHLIANGVTIPVRCKDCKHFWESFSGTHSCKLHKGLVGTKYDTFCSHGERKE